MKSDLSNASIRKMIQQQFSTRLSSTTRVDLTASHIGPLEETWPQNSRFVVQGLTLSEGNRSAHAIVTVFISLRRVSFYSGRLLATRASGCAGPL